MLGPVTVRNSCQPWASHLNAVAAGRLRAQRFSCGRGGTTAGITTMSALVHFGVQDDCAALNAPRVASPLPSLRCDTQSGCDVTATYTRCQLATATMRMIAVAIAHIISRPRRPRDRAREMPVLMVSGSAIRRCKVPGSCGRDPTADFPM